MGVKGGAQWEGIVLSGQLQGIFPGLSPLVWKGHGRPFSYPINCTLPSRRQDKQNKTTRGTSPDLSLAAMDLIMGRPVKRLKPPSLHLSTSSQRGFRLQNSPLTTACLEASHWCVLFSTVIFFFCSARFFSQVLNMLFQIPLLTPDPSAAPLPSPASPWQPYFLAVFSFFHFLLIPCLAWSQ